MKRLISDDELCRSGTVANCRMNRERQMIGSNSYAADLRFSPLAFLEDRLACKPSAAWLDLCCGTGKALIQAGQHFRSAGLQDSVMIHGVDLIGMFNPVPPGISGLSLQSASVHEWAAPIKYDLITCVHGLHYVGDKLGLIARAASWLTQDGLFIAHLDLANLKLTTGRTSVRGLGNGFREAGLVYDRKHHLISCRGRRIIGFALSYMGADDSAGPNFTGQPAVDSYYAPIRGL